MAATARFLETIHANEPFVRSPPNLQLHLASGKPALTLAWYRRLHPSPLKPVFHINVESNRLLCQIPMKKRPSNVGDARANHQSPELTWAQKLRRIPSSAKRDIK